MRSPPGILEALPTLVVVDCQKYYLRRGTDEAVNRILDHFSANVRDVISKAREVGKTIAFVENEWSGEVLPEFREAASWGRIVSIGKNRNDVLDPRSAYYPLNLPVFAALVGYPVVTQIVGVQAGLCVAASAIWMRREGIVCQALAHGIINHSAHISERFYRESNGLRALREAFECPDLLDLSMVRDEENLVDLHDRIHAERVDRTLS